MNENEYPRLAAKIPKYVSSATELSGPLSNETFFSALTYSKESY